MYSSLAYAGLEEDQFDRALTTLRVVYRPIPGGFVAEVQSDFPGLACSAALAAAAERLGELKRLGRAIRLAIAKDMPLLLERERVLLSVRPYELMDPEICSERDALYPYRKSIVLRVEEEETPRAALTRVLAAGWLLAC